MKDVFHATSRTLGIPRCLQRPKTYFGLCLASLLLSTNAFAQAAPDVLFKVATKRNGGWHIILDPATSWSDVSTSGVVTYDYHGGVTGGILAATLDLWINGWVAGIGVSEQYIVTAYVKGTPTATVDVSTDIDLFTKSTGTPQASSTGSYPINAGSISAVKPSGVTGTYTNNGSNQDTLTGSLGCATNAANDGCRTFAAYPGVTYCIPDGAKDMGVSVTASNSGNWQSKVDIHAVLDLTVDVSLGAASPAVIISAPHQGGVPVTIAALGQEVTMYNDSYDPDEGTGTTPRQGICSVAWIVTDPNSSVVASGTNINSIKFTPSMVGDYTVSLDVVDNESATDIDSILVTVQ